MDALLCGACDAVSTCFILALSEVRGRGSFVQLYVLQNLQSDWKSGEDHSTVQKPFASMLPSQLLLCSGQNCVLIFSLVFRSFCFCFSSNLRSLFLCHIPGR